MPNLITPSQDLNVKHNWKITTAFSGGALFVLDNVAKSFTGISILQSVHTGFKAAGGYHFLGLSVCTAIVGKILYEKFINTPKRKFRAILEDSFKTHTNTLDVKIKSLESTNFGYSATVQLPKGVKMADFEKCLDGIEQDTYCKVRFQHLKGRDCILEFSDKNLSTVLYEQAPKEGLKIPLATHFGWKYLDFQDGSSTHLIGGGATRMGKTCLMLLLAVHLYTQSKGAVQLYISSAKLADYYMFRNIPNVTIAEPEDTLDYLHKVIYEYEKRKRLITKLGNVNDAKTLAERYPDKAFKPIFVMVDEVAVFAEDKDVQSALTEIAERAGYVDIHLILFSQRPDAREVLKPRIKANILTKIAFTTASENDSKIILGIEGAEKLGGKAGRAILIDGLPDEVQVPYIDNLTAERLLAPYKQEKEDIEVDEQGQEDNQVAQTLPSFITQTLRDTDMS